MDGPDGWSKGWVFADDPSQMRLLRQQGGGGMMFWAGIIVDVLIGSVKVQEGVKLDSKRYCEFIDSALSDWLDDLPLNNAVKSYLCKIMLRRMQQRKPKSSCTHWASRITP